MGISGMEIRMSLTEDGVRMPNRNPYEAESGTAPRGDPRVFERLVGGNVGITLGEGK